MSVAATRYSHFEGRVCLAYKGDGEKVVSVGLDGELRVWAGIDDDDCQSHLIGDEALAVALCDAKIFTSVGGTNVLSGYNWEGDSEGVVGPRLSSDVTAVASTPDGSYVVIGCADFSVKLVNTYSFATVNMSGHTAPVLSVDITSKADFVASSSCDGGVRVWSAKDEREKRVSLTGLHHKCNDVPQSKTVAGIKFSRDGEMLAVPTGQEVKILQRSRNWTSQGMKARLDTLQKEEFVTCVDWDRNDQHIVAATDKGNLCIISYPALQLVKTVPSGRNQNICCIINNPVKNEAFFADMGGHIGLLEKIGGTSQEDVKPEDLEDMEALFNDDEDDENSFSVSKVTAQSGYVKDEDGNLTFGGQRDQERPSSALSGVSAATGTVSELRAPVLAPVRARTQPAFQPGASPEGLRNRFLVYNSVGIVKCHESEGEGSLDIEFHDVAVHHSLHFANKDNISMAALSPKVLALANTSQGGKLIVNYFSSGDVNKEWTVEMMEGEAVTGVAAGDSWVAVTTSTSHLRIFSAGGVQREVTMTPASLVSMVGAGERLMVAWQGSQQELSYSLYRVRLTGLVPLTSSPQPLPLSPDSELYWLGFSDSLTACSGDTGGWVRALDTRTGLWHPVINTRDHTKGRSDFHYIVSVSHLDNMVRAILCRGSKYPPTVPRPIPLSLALRPPLLSLSTEKGELEQTSLSLGLQAKFLSVWPDLATSEEGGESLETARQQEVETMMKLFALACRSDHESRAVEVARLLPSAETVQLAIQYSVKMKRMGLAEKLGKLAMDLQEREEGVAVVEEEEEIVKTPGDDIDYQDPESQEDMFASQESENPFLKAKRDRELRPTPSLPIYSQRREEKRNPFAKKLVGAGSVGSPSQSGIVFDSLKAGRTGLGSPGIKEKSGFGQRKFVLHTKTKEKPRSASKQPLIARGEKENRSANGGGEVLKGFQLYWAENKDDFDNEGDALKQWKLLEKEEKESYKVGREIGAGGEAAKRKRGGSGDGEDDTEAEDKKARLSTTKERLAGFAFSS